VGDVFQDSDRSFDAELFPVSASFENSLGDEKHACAGFEGLNSWLVGDVGEEAEWDGNVSEGLGAVAVTEDGGWAAGVDVGEESEREIEAADEGGGETRSSGSVVDGEVDLVGKAGKSVHEIEAIDSEAFLGLAAEDVLDVGGNGLGLVAFAGDVGEEEDEVRADEDGVEEVAAGTDGVVAGVEFEAREGRQNGGLRYAAWLGCVLH